MEPSTLRLRPIVMTGFAFIMFIMGVVPLVVAEGMSAEMQKTLDAAVFSVMLDMKAFSVLQPQSRVTGRSRRQA